MKQVVRVQLAALALLAAVAAGPARAQVPFGSPQANPNYRPPVSPYLNLLLPGNPAVNYYGIVRPQIEQGAALQQLQGAVYGPAAYPGAPGYGLPLTGHPFGFQNQWGYFQNWRTFSYGGAGAGLGGLAPGAGGLYPGITPGLGGVGAGFGTLAGPLGAGARPAAAPAGRPANPGLPVHQ